MNTNRCCIFIIAILHQNDFIRGMPNAAAEIISTAFCNFWHLLRIEVIFFLKLEVEKNCSVCIIISRDDRNTTSHWRTNPLRELGPELKSQMGFISIGNTQNILALNEVQTLLAPSSARVGSRGLGQDVEYTVL